MVKKKVTKRMDEEAADEGFVTKNVRGIGDNGEETEVDGKKLQGFVDGLEKLDKKKDQVLQDIRETYADAKAVGYDGKTIRKVLRERKDGPEKARAQAELLHIYKSALGMLDDED